jgi:hypothetical protein
VTRRAVLVPLARPAWSPPGVAPEEWRRALAEDVVDVVAALAEVEPALAAGPGDRALAEAVLWPGMRVFEVAELTVPVLLGAAFRAGYAQAALIAPDAPDLPAMLIGKLLRPLTSRALAVAPALNGTGLLGLAARLPAPEWLPSLGLDELGTARIRAAVAAFAAREAPNAAEAREAPNRARAGEAPYAARAGEASGAPQEPAGSGAARPSGTGQIAVAPGWHRLLGPGDLSRLDPGLEGWEATRALLS